MHTNTLSDASKDLTVAALTQSAKLLEATGTESWVAEQNQLHASECE